MALSFVGQDVRNRSFKGRRDLAGADFTGADLRGCDFRGADLTGANFTGAKTGKSRRQWMILIALAFVGVGMGASMDMLTRTFANVFRSVGVGAVIFAVLVGGGSLGVVRLVQAGGVERVTFFVLLLPYIVSITGDIAGDAYNDFLTGRTGLGILCSLTSLFLLASVWYLLQQSIETARSLTGTDFRGASLTGAKFVNARLRETDFTDASCDGINWLWAEFYLCTMPKNIENDKVRSLCRNFDRGRGQDYTSLDFHNAYLQNADLVDTILRYVNLNGADLHGAKLINADLSNTQALGTDFSGADFSGARIANWGINPETKFENVICTHVYIDEARKERKPASGEFGEGDFALLVTKSTETLDFLFKNEINSSAFQYAMQQMLSKNPEVKISINQTKFIGQNKDVLQESYDVIGDADKSKLHADFSEAYDTGKRLYPEDNQLIRDLNRELTLLKSTVETLKVLNAEKDERIADLKDASAGFKEIAKMQAATPITINNNQDNNSTQQQVQGDQNQVSGKDQTNSPNIALQAGGNMTGITVAGGDISGTVTVTIQQLRDSDTPEAPQLADLLTQLQQAINESTELAAPDKEKALKYLDKIGKLANDQEPDRDVISMAIDGILGIVSKAAKLLAPVQGIADGLRKLLNL